MSTTNAQGQTVLQGNGSYKFTATIDGDDLVVENATATWFGGVNDPDDDGETASGDNTKRNPSIRGCSLPMKGFHATKGSPLPKLPWHTPVRVWCHETKRQVVLNLIDVGPSPPPLAQGDIDLTQAAFRDLSPSFTTKEGSLTVDFRILGGAKFL